MVRLFTDMPSVNPYIPEISIFLIAKKIQKKRFNLVKNCATIPTFLLSNSLNLSLDPF